MDYLLDWTSAHGNDLAGFLRDWEDASPKIASPDSGASVRVMTVHKSKGLEFPYVIFPFAEKVVLYKSTARWCRPASDATPLEDLGADVYQVELSEAAEDTLFAADYRQERLLQFIDNINVFYVALTRPKYGLTIIAKTPSKKVRDAVDAGGDAAWTDLSQILYAYAGGAADYEAGTMYPFASLPREESPADPMETLWPSFPAADRGRLRFSRDAADFFGPDGLMGPQASQRLRGLVLHEILSAVRTTEELPLAVDRAVAAGSLSAGERSSTLTLLSERLASARARGWFDAPGTEILNEAALIGEDGREIRPDRVILTPDGSVIIIDYKFGEPKDDYLDQVARYADAYRRMGYRDVKGYLWYIWEKEEKVVTV